MTGREAVTAALKKIGAIAASETPAAQDATDALAELNRMISAWSLESLLIYAKTRDSLTLTPNDGEYTVSASGDLATARPIKIVEAAIRDESVSPAVEYPIRVLSLAEWQSIVAKGQTSQYPAVLYADGGYPSQTVRLYPVPTVANKLVLWSEKALTEIATLDTSISLPPGYEDALVYNLAIRLAPEYGRSASAEIVAVAAETKAWIKRKNHRPGYLRVDDVPAGRSGTYDIYSGGSR